MNALQAALLGLLALLLGFNFAMAASRFETRKALIQEEVNAITTAFTRAQLLPSPQREEIINHLKAYLAACVDFMEAGCNPSLIESANSKTREAENRIWASTNAMIAMDPSSNPKSLFIQSLNEMVNIHAKRQSALNNHVPELVINLLFTVAVGAFGFIGYGYGLTGRRRHGTTAIFALLIAMVLKTIIDLDQPRTGFIRVNEDSMQRLKVTLDKTGSVVMNSSRIILFN